MFQTSPEDPVAVLEITRSYSHARAEAASFQQFRGDKVRDIFLKNLAFPHLFIRVMNF